MITEISKERINSAVREDEPVNYLVDLYQCIFPGKEESERSDTPDEQKLGDHIVQKMVSKIRVAIALKSDRYGVLRLVDTRNLFKACPKWVRRILQPHIQPVFDALRQNSKDHAKSVIDKISEVLTEAEEQATNPAEPASRRLNKCVDGFTTARSLLNKIKSRFTVPNHIWFVGFPEAFKEMQTTREQFIIDSEKRLAGLLEVIPSLRSEAVAEEEYRREHAAEIAEKEAERRRKELTEMQAKRDKEDRRREAEDRRRWQAELRLKADQEAKQCAKRCPRAAQAAQQFLENLDTGNLGACRGNLNEIRCLDGGEPPNMKTLYADALQQKSLQQMLCVK